MLKFLHWRFLNKNFFIKIFQNTKQHSLVSPNTSQSTLINYFPTILNLTCSLTLFYSIFTIIFKSLKLLVTLTAFFCIYNPFLDNLKIQFTLSMLSFIYQLSLRKFWKYWQQLHFHVFFCEIKGISVTPSAFWTTITGTFKKCSNLPHQ